MGSAWNFWNFKGKTWDIGMYYDFFLKISADTRSVYVWIDENYLVTYINNQKDQEGVPLFFRIYFCICTFLFVFGGWGREDIIVENNFV